MFFSVGSAGNPGTPQVFALSSHPSVLFFVFLESSVSPVFVSRSMNNECTKHKTNTHTHRWSAKQQLTQSQLLYMQLLALPLPSFNWRKSIVTYFCCERSHLQQSGLCILHIMIVTTSEMLHFSKVNFLVFLVLCLSVMRICAHITHILKCVCTFSGNCDVHGLGYHSTDEYRHI